MLTVRPGFLTRTPLPRLWPDYEEASRAVGCALETCKSQGVAGLEWGCRAGWAQQQLKGWEPWSGSHRQHTLASESYFPLGITGHTQSTPPVSTGFFWFSGSMSVLSWSSPSKTGSGSGTHTKGIKQAPFTRCQWILLEPQRLPLAGFLDILGGRNHHHRSESNGGRRTVNVCVTIGQWAPQIPSISIAPCYPCWALWLPY